MEIFQDFLQIKTRPRQDPVSIGLVSLFKSLMNIPVIYTHGLICFQFVYQILFMLYYISYI